MEIFWSKEIDEILKVGKSLNGIGVNNWALTKSQAMEVLEKFSKLKVPVAGGDVYENSDGVFQSNYDNWYCDSEKNDKDYVIQSIKKSKEYIKSYNLNSKYFFVLVPSLSIG